MEETATLSRTRGPAPSSDTDALFQPYRLGSLELPHRIVMAPLTRSRARLPGNIPSALTACYYAQRASAALIVGEATQISMQGQGYAWTPGIHSSEQVEAWRHVTKAVHESGGRIFCQLWHVGRISHPALQPDNMLPVAPSALTPQGKAFIENERGEGALVPFVRPRALTLEEMPYIVAQYERAARNAQSANFDGIEIHAANGYLLDQFIESSTNRRSDAYGGPLENRTRLLLEAACWRPAHRRRPDHLLWRRRKGLHGLSVSGAGPRRAARCVRRSELEMTPEGGRTCLKGIVAAG